MATSDNTHFNQAASLYKHGRLDEAIGELKIAISSEPNALRSLTTLGAIYEAQDNNEEAAEIYRDVVKIDPYDVRANLRLGIVLSRLGLSKEALPYLRIVWETDDKNARAASALAGVLDDLGEYDGAHKMYEEALRLDPNLSDTRFNYGILLFNQDRYESAIAQFVTYMVKVGENARAHRNIGRALEEIGQLDGAISSFNKAMRLEPNDPETYFDIALVYDLKDDHQTAITYYMRAIEIAPEYAEAHNNLGELLMRSGKPNEALAQFQSLLSINPDNHSALNGIATCYINKRQFPTAIELLRRAIQLKPDYGQGHYNLGVALREDGQVESAIRHFQEAARLDPEDFNAVAAGELLIARKAIMSTHRSRNSTRVSHRLERLRPM